jgi:hypothetical protein
VYLAHGVTISFAAAADLVGVIDALALRCAPLVLSRRLVKLRNQLIECCTYANTHADVSTEGVEPEDVLSFQPDEIVDSKTAAQRLGISEAGVRWHCRQGQFMDTAKQINGRWWISRDAVDHYVSERLSA